MLSVFDAKRIKFRERSGSGPLKPSSLPEIALVLVRLDQVASRIVNANHSMTGAAVELRVTNCVADGVRLAIRQATEWQRIGNQINAPMIFARADFVNVFNLTHLVGVRGNRFTSIASRITANSGWLYQRYGTNNSETRATIPTASSVRFI